MKRVAVVTGGIGGLGTAMCKALAEQGRTVVAAYYPAEEEKAFHWQEIRRAEGYDIHVYPVDVTDFESCASLVAQVEAEVGPIEILVNNAGITRDALLRKMEKAQWDAVINTNLTSLFNMTKQVFDKMCNRGWGRIVNISSVNGQKGQFGQANYSAAKAGVHGFTMAVAQEGARKGVTVNTVSPGYIGTEMVMAIPEEVRNQIVAQIPVGRLGRPEDIARTVAFLTAEDADYITGADIYVNGGLYYH
ncbi:MAG TPA: beta-ketoacyl-ACP reductase [Candidatus Competibacteraceae bacterium]|nr:beta-ketoacyl-ACP reductase [Candidatus Competibacteraceae bacterium]